MEMKKIFQEVLNRILNYKYQILFLLFLLGLVIFFRYEISLFLKYLLITILVAYAFRIGFYIAKPKLAKKKIKRSSTEKRKKKREKSPLKNKIKEILKSLSEEEKIILREFCLRKKALICLSPTEIVESLQKKGILISRNNMSINNLGTCYYRYKLNSNIGISYLCIVLFKNCTYYELIRDRKRLTELAVDSANTEESYETLNPESFDGEDIQQRFEKIMKYLKHQKAA